jgi:hypothetical protein
MIMEFLADVVKHRVKNAPKRVTYTFLEASKLPGRSAACGISAQQVEQPGRAFVRMKRRGK